MHTGVGTATESAHHFSLTHTNQTIKLSCERSCGSYNESWLILLYRTELNRSESLQLNDLTVKVFEREHPEFSLQLRHASDADCMADTTVQFSLEMTLVNNSIHTTRGNLIISCSAAISDRAKVFAPLSTVVYLPYVYTSPAPTCHPPPFTPTHPGKPRYHVFIFDKSVLC